MADVGIAKSSFYLPSTEYLNYETCEVVRLINPIGDGAIWNALNYDEMPGKIKIENFKTLNISNMLHVEEIEVFLQYLLYYPTGTFFISKGTDNNVTLYWNFHGKIEQKTVREENNDFYPEIQKYIRRHHGKLRFCIDRVSVVFGNTHLNNNRVQLCKTVTSQTKVDLNGQQGDVLQVVSVSEDGNLYLVKDNDDSEKRICRHDVVPYIPDWFHGYIDRKANDDVLSGKRIGSFLVRKIYKTFILSVRCHDEIDDLEQSDDEPLIDIEINKYQDKVLLNDCMHESIVDVIEYIMINREALDFVEKSQSEKPLALNYPVSRHADGVDSELDTLDPQFIELYLKALSQGKEKNRSIRVMIVGHFGVGKTSLARNLLGLSLSELENTNGIDVHQHKCRTTTEGLWKPIETAEDVEDDVIYKRMAIAAKTSCMAKDSSDSETKKLNDNNENRYIKEMVEIPKTNENNQERQSQVKVTSESTQSNVEEQEHQTTMASQSQGVRSDLPVRSKVKIRKFTSAYKVGKENDRLINVWDFGGQYIFYATHQLFHSPRAVYLLVLDLSKSLDDTVKDEDCPKTPSVCDRKDVKSFCKFWMNSIHTCVGGLNGNPPVILVGTHKDMLHGNEAEKSTIAERYFDDVRELFHKTPILNHIEPCHFLIDNLTSKKEIEQIRKHIVNIAEVKNMTNHEVPVKWIPLERELLNRKDEKHMSFQEVCKIDSENDCPIKNEDEIRAFLAFHHLQGALIYFEKEPLSEVVVLDPQWIIDAFKCIITSKQFCKIHPELRYLWDDLTNNAILRPLLITEVWSQNDEKDYMQHKDILLKFLTRLGIIANMQQYCEVTNTLKELDRYVVPSLLLGICKQVDVCPLVSQGHCTFPLVFVFNNEFVSPTIYHRTTAAAIGKWSVVEYDGKTMLYENLGVYRLDEDHIGIIEVTMKTLELRVANICDKMAVDNRHSDRLRRFIELVFKHEFERFREQNSHIDNHNRIYQLGVRCNVRKDPCKSIILVDELDKHGHANCLDCTSVHTIKAKTIYQEWFPGKVKDRKAIDGALSIMSGLEQLNSESLKRNVTEREIDEIAHAIGYNWESLGIALGMSDILIEQIKMDYQNTTYLRIFKMLNKWRQRDKNATVHFLLQTLTQNPQVSVSWDMIKNMLDKLSP